ncbi:UTRA domain-containing protein [Cupriavidus basilensis]
MAPVTCSSASGSRAPAEIARLLDIRTGDSVVQIRRVLTFSGESTVLDEIWLLGANFKGLTAEKLTGVEGPHARIVRGRFGTRMIRAS